MTNRIVFTRLDGGVSVVVPCISIDDPIGFTESQAVERALKSLPESASNIRVVNVTAISSDRTFRDAWIDSGKKIEVDMEKAKEIWREKLRQDRAPLLKALDVEYQRADESNDKDKKDEIIAKKQYLRDITKLPEIEAAKTPDELKAIWLELD